MRHRRNQGLSPRSSAAGHPQCTNVQCSDHQLKITKELHLMPEYIIAIDQGTTSSRAIVFDHSGSIVSSGQLEHEQIFPQAGWVEHNPAEIWNNTREVIASALSKANLTRHDIAAVGITNQ